MILIQQIKVKISSNNAKYYENLGYKIPKKFSYGKERYILGSEIEVLVRDLQQNSNILVPTKCDSCGKESERPYYSYIKFNGICVKCASSSRSGSKSSNWKGGVATSYCVDCGKKVYGNNNGKKTQRCSECHKKHDISTHKFCIDCGKPISSVSLRCQKCFGQTKLGSNNPSFDHNMTNEEREERLRYSRKIVKWRTEVIKRDKCFCQKCKNKGKIHNSFLEAHHIFNFRDFKEKRLDIDNGITLCETCHIDFHKKYGKRNNNQEQLMEFLKYE